MLHARIEPERVAAALLKDPALALEVAVLLTWVAGPWKAVDGGHERKDPWGRLVAKTYDHSRIETPLVLLPWKWVVWMSPCNEKYAVTDSAAMLEADLHLRKHGWTLAGGEP